MPTPVDWRTLLAVDPTLPAKLNTAFGSIETIRRELAAAIAAAAAAVGPPSGAAGGQLGGTYPDPDVRGLRETAGPTLLTLGAWADGDFLKRVGSTAAGATPPSSASVDLRGFRSKDQGGAFSSGSTRVHVAGYANTGGRFAAQSVASLQGIGAGQMLYAIPEYFPRGGIVNRLVIRTNGAVGSAGSPRVRMGVHADGVLSSGSLTGSPYAAARLGQSASIDMWAGGPDQILETVGLSIAVAAGTHVWFSVMFNADAVTNQHTIPAFAFLYPVQGFTFDVGTTIASDAQKGGVGWRHAVTYGTTEDIPDPFPQSSPVILTDPGAGVNQFPVIGYGFQPS